MFILGKQDALIKTTGSFTQIKFVRHAVEEFKKCFRRNVIQNIRE
jgi:fatty acid/phospholipid biosynthesis enzyme